VSTPSQSANRRASLKLAMFLRNEAPGAKG
jgi:hypothetical protein